MAILIIRDGMQNEEDPVLAALDKAVQCALEARSAFAKSRHQQAIEFDVEFEGPPSTRARAVCPCGVVYSPSSTQLITEKDFGLPEGEEPFCAFVDPWDIRDREEDPITIFIDDVDEVICHCGARLPIRARFERRLAELKG